VRNRLTHLIGHRLVRDGCIERAQPLRHHDIIHRIVVNSGYLSPRKAAQQSLPAALSRAAAMGARTKRMGTQGEPMRSPSDADSPMR